MTDRTPIEVAIEALEPFAKSWDDGDVFVRERVTYRFLKIGRAAVLGEE